MPVVIFFSFFYQMSSERSLKTNTFLGDSLQTADIVRRGHSLHIILPYFSAFFLNSSPQVAFRVLKCSPSTVFFFFFKPRGGNSLISRTSETTGTFLRDHGA